MPRFRPVSITRATLPEPMYATLGHALPRGAGWTYEPKYDGMRVLAEASSRRVRLMTRNGKDKRAQFPEVVTALRTLATRTGRTVVLDGEVVARRGRARAGAPKASEFQRLQARMHLKDAGEIARLSIEAPATLVAFDLLRDGRTALTARPWAERRERLDALFTDSAADDWLKLKLQFRAEFVVGGFTEPRRTRPFLGALLLGAYNAAGQLAYVGHMGGGFDREGLRAMRARLEKLERRTAPFAETPRTNEPAHWVAPKLVVEVKFAEWTTDGRLRQPIFLGVRDDKAPRDVTIEGISLQRWGTGEIADDAA